MLPISVVLHPTDFSPPSANALQLACALARDYRARLVLLHVLVPPPIAYGEGVVVPADAEAAAREEKQLLDKLEIPDSGIQVERWNRNGDPADEILRVAEEITADVIVVGTHARTGLGRLLLGSVTEQVVRQALCPVLTVTGRTRIKAPLGPAGAAQPARANGRNGANGEKKDIVQEASEESFPASDAPAWTAQPRA